MERRRTGKSAAINSMEGGDATAVKQSSNLKGDRKNVALLFFLYTLQGIPLGLAAAIPMILQNRGVSYKQQVNTK